MLNHQRRYILISESVEICRYTNEVQVAVVMPSDPSKDPALTRHSPVYQEKRAAPNKIEVIKDAVDDLKILSLPSGVAEKDPNYLGYYYDATAGQDTMVYVVDSGAAIDHHVSSKFCIPFSLNSTA